MGLMRKLGLKPPVARAAGAASDDAGSDDPDPDDERADAGPSASPFPSGPGRALRARRLGSAAAFPHRFAT